jgi:ketosteroid isomerase-like protein
VASAGGCPGGSSLQPIDDDGDVPAVLAANQAYYDAFEAADMDLMSEIWEHSDRVVCTHPGWATLRGWSRVAASWFAIFRNPARLQVILTEPEAVVTGEVGWVTVNENLLGGGLGGTVAALNIFVRTPAGWRMVVHHGSSVVGS